MLEDSETIKTRIENPKFKEGPLGILINKFGVLQFHDLTYSKENKNETSKVNDYEVSHIENLIWNFV